MPKAPPVFTVDSPLEAGAVVALDERARRHARARRLSSGDAVRLTGAAGAQADGTIARMDRNAVEVRIGRVSEAAASLAVELYVPAIRTPRLSWLVEKATELGAGVVTIVASARAQRDRVDAAELGRARFQRVAREAAEQSGQPIPPRIAGPIPAAEVLSRAGTFASALVLDRSGEPFPRAIDAPAALWIGPEGGWTPGELGAAESAGWRRVRIPGATLRAETAAIAALTLALSAIDSAARAGGK